MQKLHDAEIYYAQNNQDDSSKYIFNMEGDQTQLAVHQTIDALHIHTSIPTVFFMHRTIYVFKVLQFLYDTVLREYAGLVIEKQRMLVRA